MKAVLVFWAAVAYLVAVGPLAVALARSWRGRLEGLLAAAANVFAGTVLALVVCGVVGAHPPAYLWTMLNWAGAAFLALCFVTCPVALFRPCYPNVGGPLLSHFFGPALHPEETGWADTEDEHAFVLIWLATRFDWRMSGEEAVAVRGAMSDLADETRTHPDYHRLARAGTRVGRTLMSGRLDPGHCFLYCPPGDGPLGLLVFLHGHGTNYLLAVHALRPIADECRLAIVAPTFGYGNWEARGGVEAVRRARDYALKALPVDPARVYLMGLSQGGAGVGRAAAADPAAYAGLVFVSATMEPDVLGSGVFAAGWGRKPILVIQGGQDRNVTPESVAAGVAVLRANGADVTARLDPEAGHFLFFTHRDGVRDWVGGWIARGFSPGRGGSR